MLGPSLSRPPHKRNPPTVLNVEGHDTQTLPSLPSSSTEKSSLDITQRLERKLAQYNASNNIFKCWLFEIVSVASSCICMGFIIAILRNLEDRSLNTWPAGLTIITILSKIASAALIIPISEAIGQLKWTWFQGKKSKDAFDFEIFDKASRGAWGSVLLLIRTRGRSLAALGAFLTVLLLAIDTFFQQVTDLPERWVLKDQSFIPRTVRYNPDTELAYDTSVDAEAPVSQLNRDLHKALTPYYYDQNGSHPLTTVGNNNQAEISLSCPTSKCEWDPYETLGVCSACEEVSHLLEYACLTMSMDWILNSTGPSTEHTYPNGTACGYFLNVTSKAPVLMSGYRVNHASNSSFGETLLMRTLPLVTNPLRQPLYGGSINFKHIQYPILDALIVSAADGTPGSIYRKELPVAHECMLSWCVKTLRSSYRWGGYHEEVVDTLMNTTKTAEYPWSGRFTGPNSFENNFSLNISIFPPSMPRDGAGFGVSEDTFYDTVVVLDEIFPTFLTTANASAKPLLKIRTSYTDRVMYRAVRFNPWVAPNNVPNHMERMAEAMTNVVRSDSRSNELVVGKAYSLETFVAVRWAWLTFPLAMLLLSIVFLAATIFKTARHTNDSVGMWKTSAMPSLSYGLSNDTPIQLATSSSKTETVRIRLLPKQGWRISRNMHPHLHVREEDENKPSTPPK